MMAKKNKTTKATTAVATKEVVEEDAARGADKAEIIEERTTEWLLEQRVFGEDEHPVPVEVCLGLTKNLGDYQSARMDIRVGAYCLVDEVPEYVERIHKWIAKKLSTEVRRIDESFVETPRRHRRR